MTSLVSKFGKWLLSKPGYRQEILAELKSAATFEEKKGLTDAFIADDPGLQSHVASSAAVQGALAADSAFLISSALDPDMQNAFFRDERVLKAASQAPAIHEHFRKDLNFLRKAALAPENRKQFFDNGEVQDTVLQISSVSDRFGKNLRFLVRSALSPDIRRAFFDNGEIKSAVAELTYVRKSLGKEMRFLVTSALDPDNRKAFFGNGEVQAAIAETGAIRDLFGNDVRFLVSYALREGHRKAFFGNGEVQAAIAETGAIRDLFGNDVRFLVSYALREGHRKAFFGNGEVQAAIAETGAIRDLFGNDARFLVNYSLKDENRKAVFGNCDVQAAVTQLSSTRYAILTSQLNEAEAVGILSGKWSRRERQLSGFSSYFDILSRLKPYYGDSPVLKALEEAPLPPEGFPGGAELSDFITSQLCRDGKFLMREHEVTYVDRHAIWTLLHEILIDQEYYFETSKKAPFIIDGGANFGMSSIYFKELYPDAEVLSFEPVPFLHELATRNVADNGLAGVTILRKGLSAEKGQATFFMSQDYSMAGSLTERRKAFGDEVNELTIETVPLADYLDREVDFLKLDIEGAEGAVLMAAGDKIANVRQMCVEWHLNANHSSIALDEVLALLTRNGFRYQIGKSANYARRSRSRPMTHLGDMGTLNFWAARET